MEYALKMEEWSDARKTSEEIFTLINKKSSKKIEKVHLQSFFTDLSCIFWKSKNYLFHSYALLNVYPIFTKSTGLSAEDKAIKQAELVFSALSVSLTNRLSNFERLSTNYMPKEIRQEFENTSSVTQEILKVS